MVVRVQNRCGKETLEETLKDERRKQEILSKGFKTEEDFAKKNTKIKLNNLTLAC